MIDELIDEERKKVLERLNEYEQAKTELNQINRQIEKVKLEINELNQQSLVPIISQKFNVFQKIFSKKYREYVKQKEEFERKSEEIQQSISSKSKLITDLKRKKNQQNQITSNIDRDEIKSEIDMLADREKAIARVFELHSELSENKELIGELIEISPQYIKYDKTNNPTLYIKILEKMKDEIKDSDSNMEYFIEDIDKLLDTIRGHNNQVDEGKYQIPLKYLFEDIRSEIIEQEESSIYNNPWYNNATNSVWRYNQLNGQFQNSFGKEFEKLYENPDYILTVHGTGRNSGHEDSDGYMSMKQIKNQIMVQGIKATNALGQLDGISAPELDQTARRVNNSNFSFLKFLDYDYADVYGFFIMQIPKKGIGKDGNIPIWGTNTNKMYGGDRKYYVLPEYIKGFVETRGRAIKPEDRVLEKKTDYTNDVQYNQKVFDSSIYNQVVFEDNYEKQ